MVFYDFEVFQYDWLVVIFDMTNKKEHVIINDSKALKDFYEEHKGDVWIGYNSRHYDQYILKGILCGFNPKEISDWIVVDGKGGWQFSKLFIKIPLNNFDIMTTFHGLKQLEGFMGEMIKESDVSFDIERKLTSEEIEDVVKYCRHDVEQTIKVFIKRKQEFESHMQLITTFHLPLYYISKTKVQLSAIILDAHKVERNDEFDIEFPDTLILDKYKNVLDWYKDEENRDYTKENVVEVAGIEHVFAWGGLHGAIPNYIEEGRFLNIDVASYYPALMIEYGWGSRNMSNPDKYREIRDTRIKLKNEKNPLQAPYKIVLNGTYGAMKDKFNNLYDPRQANNVCVGGQLLLLDLIEKLEGKCKLIQSNTDGLIVKIDQNNETEILEICKEWESRTRMKLEYDYYSKMIQKDVNNYIIVDAEGNYKSKGAYVKKLNELDFDLPIVNKAVVDYFIKGISVEETILNCKELKMFQNVVKVSSKYMYALYGEEIMKEKCLRVFASKNKDDKGVFKLKEKGKNPEKIAGTPQHCFILNEDINHARIPRRLDKNWYVELAKKRIMDFEGRN